MPKNMSELQARIGYTFENKQYLEIALVHSSYSNEQRSRNASIVCNERLEFLGDSVLSVLVSEYLYLENKFLPEGELTKLRKEIVCGKALAEYAREIDLGEYMYLGNGERKNGGSTKENIVADAFEALLAAIYLDAGADGKQKVAEFLMPFVKRKLKALIKKGHGNDYKTDLQQFVQQTEGDFLEYIVVSESGPDHMKTFEVEARLNSNIIGHGKGHTKREAEQNAAKEALSLFGEA